jgi:hypothetical protein
MLWILGAVALLFLVPHLLKGRRGQVPVLPGQPITTIHSAISRRTSRETKAALDAATALLR